MVSTIRTAIIGAGNISATHARVLRGLEGVDISAVVDRDLTRARELASNLKVDTALDGIGPRIDGDLCDAAHGLVPPDAHRSVGEALLRAGIHVLMEKPLATTEEDCIALQEASVSGGARLDVNQNLVYNQMFLKAKDIIRSGRIGRLHHLMSIWNVRDLLRENWIVLA